MVTALRSRPVKWELCVRGSPRSEVLVEMSVVEMVAEDGQMARMVTRLLPILVSCGEVRVSLAAVSAGSAAGMESPCLSCCEPR